MSGFNSKYTGREVEARLDKVDDIDEIKEKVDDIDELKEKVDNLSNKVDDIEKPELTWIEVNPTNTNQ